MGYVLRVRLASFFAGMATASAVAFYVLHRDYKIAHDAISQQGASFSLDHSIVASNPAQESMVAVEVESLGDHFCGKFLSFLLTVLIKTAGSCTRSLISLQKQPKYRAIAVFASQPSYFPCTKNNSSPG